MLDESFDKWGWKAHAKTTTVWTNKGAKKPQHKPKCFKDSLDKFVRTHSNRIIR